MKFMKRFTPMFWLISLSAALLVFGCEKSTTDPGDDTSLSATQDAAESMASDLAEDNGGITDQIADVMEIATTTGLDASSKTDGTQQVSKTYDPATGIWTLTLERERGSTVGAAYAYIRRVYQYQFRNAQGQPQQYYITGADTAASISFDIVEGVGRHRNFRISQELTSLSGSFLATGTNTDWITLNGNYQRSAVDTLTTRQAVRTLDHSIALTLTDVRGPRGLRGSRGNISEMISGTISGTYTATATFTSGSGYRERNITRTFLIDLSNGTASMEVDGKTYVSDLESGELVENN